MKFDEKQQAVEDVLINLPDEELLEIYNTVAEDWSYEQVYRMSDLDESGLATLTNSELIELGSNGFDVYDNYFIDAGLDSTSSDNVYSLVDDSLVAQYIIDNDNDFGNDDIREILDDEDEE